MNREKHIHCIEREEAITMLACGELAPEAAAALEPHLNECAGCAEAFEQEKRLREACVLNAGTEPSQALLAECRTQLDAAIDRAGVPGFWTRVWAGFAKGGWRFHQHNWLAAHPAWGAAVFVIAGIVIGNVAPRWFAESSNPGAIENAVGFRPQMVVSPRGEAARMGVTDITLSPSNNGDGILVVRGMRETPLQMRGTLDDPMIRQAVLDVFASGQRASADTRMLALEFLAQRGTDTQVRDSLCQTARLDEAPAVRLKAVEALRGFEADEAVRKTLLQVLLNDSNAGVRIEAVNSLKSLAEAENTQLDGHMVQALRERMEKDPNTYIRVQSAATVRQLAQKGVY